MKRISSILISVAMLASCSAGETGVVLGDMQPKAYLPVLEGKRVALMSNQTGLAGTKADATSSWSRGSMYP